MNYKVTLAMPVYNVEKYVERALLSALNQTFDSIEFLIVDDKGTDRSMEIVSEIVSTHPRGKDVRIIDHVVNQGTGATKIPQLEKRKVNTCFSWIVMIVFQEIVYYHYIIWLVRMMRTLLLVHFLIVM